MTSGWMRIARVLTTGPELLHVSPALKEEAIRIRLRGITLYQLLGPDLRELRNPDNLCAGEFKYVTRKRLGEDLE
jgi:hypothetical protein